MCGTTARGILALAWWLAFAAIMNAQQPDADRPTQPDDASGSVASIAGAPDQQTGIQTICQMVEAAAERLLRNPFDPAEALPKSAKFLRDLHEQFGNLGLAAAAYNAGPTRVRDWLAGRRSLPSETQAYVRIVTGRRAEEWRPQATLSTLNVTVPVDMPCEKIAARPPMPKELLNKDTFPWGVQLIGDPSEVKALAAY